jgi:hypothetical protein
MKRLLATFFATCSILLAFAFMPAQAEGAKILCTAWCTKCGPGPACEANCAERKNPMVDASCSVRYKPVNSSPTGVCAAGTISCGGYCDEKYQTAEQRYNCKNIGPKSCKGEFGTILACVKKLKT